MRDLIARLANAILRLSYASESEWLPIVEQIIRLAEELRDGINNDS